VDESKNGFKIIGTHAIEINIAAYRADLNLLSGILRSGFFSFS